MTSSLSCCLCGGVYATCECDNRTHGLAGMHVLQARLVRLLLAHEKKTREVENQKQMLTDILKCCGVDATAFVEAPGRAATQLTQHVNELQLARDVLLARGSRVNLTHMLGAHQERGEALLGACKKLVSAGLGSLSRHVPGSVLLLDFAGLSPVTLTMVFAPACSRSISCLNCPSSNGVGARFAIVIQALAMKRCFAS